MLETRVILCQWKWRAKRILGNWKLMTMSEAKINVRQGFEPLTHIVTCGNHEKGLLPDVGHDFMCLLCWSNVAFQKKKYREREEKLKCLTPSSSFFSLSTAIAFFEHVNLLYGAVSEYCTPTSCPDMLGPGQRYVTFLSPLFSDLIIRFRR